MSASRRALRPGSRLRHHPQPAPGLARRQPPGYTLGCWLRDYAGQAWLFTREPGVEWTDNCSEQAVKAAKRHQAVSGYWHTPRTLARWCLIRSYLDSAADHGLTALDAITRALNGNPWLPRASPLNPSPGTAAYRVPAYGSVCIGQARVNVQR
ncbi:MAG: hypothetical protein ACR2MP_01145 [Streptosporangiaceae bacterium]